MTIGPQHRSLTDGRCAPVRLVVRGALHAQHAYMEFEWDEAKHARTLRERGIGFDDGARIFGGPVLMWEDTRRDYGEERFRAVGETSGDILHVTFTRRGKRVRIISVRRANRKEAELWQLQN